MPTHLLQVDYSEELEFSLVGLSSNQREHRLAWSLNTTMRWDLERREDAEVFGKQGKSLHTCFVYRNPEDHVVYSLLSNRGQGGWIIPDWQRFDYLLKIENNIWTPTDELCRSIRRSPLVLAAILLPADQMKSIYPSLVS
ncbi:MAG: IPExxxVDY family protein [Flavobacteriales bacterium]|jgi:hypothetical protein